MGSHPEDAASVVPGLVAGAAVSEGPGPLAKTPPVDRAVAPGSAPRLLGISFAFPPLAFPRSIQVARLLRHVDFRVDLICADDASARHDPTLEPDAASSLESLTIVPFRITTPRRVVTGAARRWCRPLWMRLNEAPDQHEGWGRGVRKAVAEYQRHHAPDLLATFSQPHSVHLIGLVLKKRHGWPWLAHFSDPWLDNPFQPKDRWSARRNATLEREVIRNADRVVFTSQETVDVVMAKYPSSWLSKTRVLPHAFDDSHVAHGTPSEPVGPIIIRYVGNFYGVRSPEPLLTALQAIARDHPSELSDVRFELVGGAAQHTEMIAAFAAATGGLVSPVPPVGYRDSLRMMAEADGLLVVDAPADVSVFLPSKLIDYVGASRPIMGITPVGAARTLITELGGRVADPDDHAAVVAALRRFLHELVARRADRAGHWGAPDVRSRYDPVVVASAFDSIAREMLSA